jgi:tRNA (cmo5U34)-methyltransferase
MAVRVEPDEHDWGSKQYVDQWIEDARSRDERRVASLLKMVSFIPKDRHEAIRVLDVGGGYGLVSQQVLELFPRAALVLQDYSEPMFEHAKRNLAWAAERVSYVKADLFDPAWNKAFAGQFDAVVSGIAIHNLRDPKRIRGVYTEVFPLIAPGGCFLNYDRIPSTSPVLSSAYRHGAIVAEQQRIKAETGQEKSLAEIQRLVEQGQRIGPRELPPGEPANLENQLRWLREAGFDASDAIWKEGSVAIIAGLRA